MVPRFLGDVDFFVLQRYLERAIDAESGIRRQDGGAVVARVANNQVGRDMAWTWIRENWEKIITYFDTSISSVAGSIVKSCAGSFNTRLELTELKDFYEKQKGKLGSGRIIVEEAIERVTANVKWMESSYETIVSWLKEKTKTKEISSEGQG